jgi:hypothetical protein
MQVSECLVQLEKGRFRGFGVLGQAVNLILIR